MDQHVIAGLNTAFMASALACAIIFGYRALSSFNFSRLALFIFYAAIAMVATAGATQRGFWVPYYWDGDLGTSIFETYVAPQWWINDTALILGAVGYALHLRPLLHQRFGWSWGLWSLAYMGFWFIVGAYGHRAVAWALGG